MKSYQEIAVELTPLLIESVSLQNEININHYLGMTLISTIKKYLEPLEQKNELMLALKIIRSPISAHNIFHYACMIKCKELRTLLETYELIPDGFKTTKNTNNQTPLSVAVQFGDEDYVIEFLKENPLCANELTTPQNISLLELAAKNLNYNMVKILIDFGADVILYGKASLYAAFNQRATFDERKQNQVVELLIQHGARIFNYENIAILPEANFTKIDNPEMNMPIEIIKFIAQFGRPQKKLGS